MPSRYLRPADQPIQVRKKAADCERIIADTVTGLGRLDIFVNNDGAPPLGASLDFDDTIWLRAVEQNLLSVVRMSRAAVPHMRDTAADERFASERLAA
jgi:NAD(P)-dependent dehydrogenase (short-subunit alcohol dehydrogenase family)